MTTLVLAYNLVQHKALASVRHSWQTRSLCSCQIRSSSEDAGSADSCIVLFHSTHHFLLYQGNSKSYTDTLVNFRPPNTIGRLRSFSLSRRSIPAFRRQHVRTQTGHGSTLHHRQLQVHYLNPNPNQSRSTIDQSMTALMFSHHIYHGVHEGTGYFWIFSRLQIGLQYTELALYIDAPLP